MVAAKENKNSLPPGHKHTRDRSSLVQERANPFHIGRVLCICIEACNRPEKAGHLSSCPVLSCPCPLRHPGRLRPGGTRKHQGK